MDLNLVSNDNIIDENAIKTDPIVMAVNKYDKHPSILKIKEFGGRERIILIIPY